MKRRAYQRAYEFRHGESPGFNELVAVQRNIQQSHIQLA